ncbi:DEAD/DEAH box helicase [Mycoplasma sp. NEAQ87857]|uniref:DEAD/DEAH box helicase n=1 Tax=Mycoplasma sp. NEAQ87857 TaxID=2683967 RepID=UPI00131D8D8C|nr:DEAD/DEAH box helicase family protein [Mycoplasma sp. NEAQ87857]
MKLTNLQQLKVDEIINHFTNPNLETYNNDKNQLIVSFSAPTGSGKTFMMANVIDKMISYANGINKKIMFVIATLSSGDLPKQLEHSLIKYKSWLVNNNFEISYEESPSSNKNFSKKDWHSTLSLDNNKVFIFGKSTFGSKRIFTEEQIIEQLIHDAKNQGYKIVYIRDEAHVGIDSGKTTNNSKDDLRFEELLNSNADYLLYMTATPKNKDWKRVVLSERELRDDTPKLIKENMFINADIEGDSETIDNEKLLKSACVKFKEIIKEYADNEKEPGLVNINPAMLIQIRNKTNGDQDFYKQVEMIKDILNEHNLTYTHHINDDKEIERILGEDKLREGNSLKDISRDDSGYQVIIFKVGPATGWNIPRATMLVQLRNVSSETLNTQTVGRIKRNPNPAYPHSEDSVAYKYYIYSNNPKMKNYTNVWNLKEKFKSLHQVVFKGVINEEKLTKTLKDHNSIEEVSQYLTKTSITNAVKFLIESYKENYDLIDGVKYHFIPLISRLTLIKDENNQQKESTYIERKAFNSIDLKIFVNEILSKNKKEFDVIQSVPNFEQNCQEIIDKLNQTQNTLFITKDIILVAINTYLLSDIKGFIKKKIELTKGDNNIANIFSLQPQTIPTYFEEFTDDYQEAVKKAQSSLKNKSGFFDITEIKTYAFESVYDQNLIKYHSKPQEHSLKTLKKVMNKKDDKELIFWYSNPVFSGINVQVLNKDNELKNSYPDIVCSYKGIHTIFVEIKSEKNDYDSVKTDNLLDNYKDYVKSYNLSSSNKLFKNERTVTFILMKDNNENGREHYIIKGASTHKGLAAKLESESIGQFSEILDALNE